MAKVITALVLFACALAAPQALAQIYEPGQDVYADADKLRQEAQTLYMDAEQGKALAEQLAETARLTEQRARRLRAMAAPASKAAGEMHDLSSELTDYQEKMDDNFREPAEIESVTIHAHVNEEEWVSGMNSLFFGFSQEMSASADDFRRRADKLSDGANIIINAADAEEASAKMMFEQSQAVSEDANTMQQDADIKTDWAGALVSLVGDWQCAISKEDQKELQKVNEELESESETDTEITEEDKAFMKKYFGFDESLFETINTPDAHTPNVNFKNPRILASRVYYSLNDEYTFSGRSPISFAFTMGETQEVRLTVLGRTVEPSIEFKIDITLSMVMTYPNNFGTWDITPASKGGMQITLEGGKSDIFLNLSGSAANSVKIAKKLGWDFDITEAGWITKYMDSQAIEAKKQQMRQAANFIVSAMPHNDIQMSRQEFLSLATPQELTETHSWQDWQDMCQRI